MEEFTWFMRGAMFGALFTGAMIWLQLHLAHKRSKGGRKCRR